MFVIVILTININIKVIMVIKVLPVNSRGWTHTLANLTSNLCWFLVTKTFQDLQVFVTIFILSSSLSLIDSFF